MQPEYLHLSTNLPFCNSLEFKSVLRSVNNITFFGIYVTFNLNKVLNFNLFLNTKIMLSIRKGEQ